MTITFEDVIISLMWLEAFCQGQIIFNYFAFLITCQIVEVTHLFSAVGGFPALFRLVSF